MTEDEHIRAVDLKEELTKELHQVIRDKLEGESPAVIETVLDLMHEQFRFWRNFNPGSEW